MSFAKGPLSYEVNKEGINEVVEESGNMVAMLRQVAWNGREEKLELRKWIVDTESEKPMKGCALSEEGWHSCTELLVKHGFGNTREILRDLAQRDKFDDDLVAIIGKKKASDARAKEVVQDDDYFMPTRDNLGI